MSDDGPKTITLLIFFFICLLISGFFAAATNNVALFILKEYQGLLAGLGGVTAALIAYKAATEKINLDRKHKEEDEERRHLARHLQAIRVARFSLSRVTSLINNLNRGEDLNLDYARFYWTALPVAPSKEMIECLNNASELDPKVLVQLHRLYSTLEFCHRYTTTFDKEGKIEDVLRNKDGWQKADFKTLDKNLRVAHDLCRAIITLGREKAGSEFEMTREEFIAARDKTEIITKLKEEVQMAEKPLP